MRHRVGSMVLFGKIDKREFREEPAATAAVEKRPLRPPSGRTSKKRNVGSRIPEARDVRAFAILSGASSSGAKGERQMKTTRVSSCNYSACAHRDPNLLVLKFEPLACVMGSRPRPVAYVHTAPAILELANAFSRIFLCVERTRYLCTSNTALLLLSLGHGKRMSSGAEHARLVQQL